MAFLFTDHVHTKAFTPREHQVALHYAALGRNIIICLGRSAELSFIGTKLIQEFAIGERKSLARGGRRIVCLLESEEACEAKALRVEQSTDLRVLQCPKDASFDEEGFREERQVLALTVDTCARLIAEGLLLPEHVKLLLIDKCHLLLGHAGLDEILRSLGQGQTRVVGFAVPLYSLTHQPGLLSYEIQRIESVMRCQIETASDLLSLLRYSPKPREYVLAYKLQGRDELANVLWNCATHALDFINEHRYDPSEIYQDEFLEEIKKMPNPVEKPCRMINDFLYILEVMGPCAADRAAFVLLLLVEKLKIKTPYDRHYLLLGMLTTLFVKIRAICDSAFEGLTEAEKIFNFSTPKIHRLIEVIKIFTPAEKEKSEGSAKESVKPEPKKEDSVHERPFRNAHRRPDSDFKRSKYVRFRAPTDPDLLCGLIFVDSIISAKVLFHLTSELSKNEDAFRFLSPLYMSEKTNDDIISSRDLDHEHKKQEDVLKMFRIHECNLLISTAVLEEGIDIPKCNFVMRFDFPKNYQSYLQCKIRARAPDALHVLLAPEDEALHYIKELAHYHHIERILLSKCSSQEASPAEELEADAYDSLLPEYKPLPDEDAPRVTLNSAISLVNRYCAKLPSDTFTRLTPEWKFSEASTSGLTMHICSLRLPINSPLKYSIASYPMPSRALAKRLVALRMCVQLHKERELDDWLLPVGKENFRAHPEDGEVPALPEDEVAEALEARPGTTKRRQYYYKKIADALIDCRPEAGSPYYLYHVRMVLSCPLPEEQNTRGRKIYPPEESAIGFGILTSKRIPKVCPFPIYTRSGEVRVELRLCRETVLLDEAQIVKAVSFLNYTFTNVLRLQKYLMLFDPSVSENSYIIVPVKRPAGPDDDVSVDWDFVELIYTNRSSAPTRLSEESRRGFSFDPSRYNDAVVMPWYRNQDQPQYFYVAEICNHLSPGSSFPGSDYRTFEEYYLRKYDIQIQNLEQPLLDVDHTSARLNFLTPRYVNRKGVALPTSSEETKRAKRENLEQKQILVAELCAIHPFPASLWRQAVCLPCILYRINALLLADQIRLEVARAIGLGRETLPEDFEWSALDFGWSFADVLNKSRESDKSKLENKEKHEIKENKSQVNSSQTKVNNSKNSGEEEKSPVKKESEMNGWSVESTDYGDELEIGTWSNDMLESVPESKQSASNGLVEPNWGNVRYGSPTFGSASYDDKLSVGSCSDDYDDYCDFDYNGEDSSSSVADSQDNDKEGLQIAYNNDNEAEAFDNKNRWLGPDAQEKQNDQKWDSQDVEGDPEYQRHRTTHEEQIRPNEQRILDEGWFVPAENPVTFERKTSKARDAVEVDLEHEEYVRQVGETFRSELKKPNGFVNKQVPAMKSAQPVQLPEGSFSFDQQPELDGHPGPSPSLILQALTMSNANDGINLERLETIGDSFLKYAITTYLFCTYNNIHEGKLSHLRSKQVSNLNLYRLGRRKCLGESMIATKFEPHDNWLPPCYKVPKELEQALIESGIPSDMWTRPNLGLYQPQQQQGTVNDELDSKTQQKLKMIRSEITQQQQPMAEGELQQSRAFIPYNLITQHSIPDKSIADCVEALIGAYLIACGPRGALLFMSWLGIHVLPADEVSLVSSSVAELPRVPGSTSYLESEPDRWTQLRYGSLQEPASPLFYNIERPEEQLTLMLDGYEKLEESIHYTFTNRSYLLQAFTHASYQPNLLTDCYQRLEFLGDAVLDYLITRHLYEDPRQHSPGALTDLRSALVNNTIFASLAVRCGFHKYFRHLSPGLNAVIDRFVRIQEENGHAISEEYYLLGEAELDEEAEEAEDVEVPKALGDVFESLAGAIYLDSNMSLDAVWRVYYEIMRAEIEQFSANVPKSPIRELLELEPETAKFGRPEKLADGKRVRVTVDVFGKGSFKGIGRNYRIAKCTAAKCALKKLKKPRKSV